MSDKVRDSVSGGVFQAKLIVADKPKAQVHVYEVGQAGSPEEALEKAVVFWRSSTWRGPKPGKGTVAYIFRRLPESQVIEDGPSFVGYFGDDDAQPEIARG
jgi:hypothetical protein